jgi:D-alanyl-lipoteichoic acid acyltransferase DltB (MBOAT superfamily)
MQTITDWALFYYTSPDNMWVGGYFCLAFLCLWAVRSSALRHGLFMILNVGVVLTYFFAKNEQTRIAGELFLVFVGIHGVLTLIYVRRPQYIFLYWLSFLVPIGLLIVFKITEPLVIAGFSYASFRMAKMAMEVQQNEALSITPASYLGFLFFPPTFASGPISAYALYLSGVNAPQFSRHNFFRGAERLIIGYVKFRFISALFNEFTIVQMLDDGFHYGAINILIGAMAYYLYLYFSFSGLMDCVIGLSAMLGLAVQENFDRPLAARNLKEFWNRWHITLSEFCRDALFTPITLYIARRYGTRAILWGSCLAALITFLVIGLWHGIYAGYAIFGVLHGVGFCVLLVFEEALKRRKMLKTYLANRYLRLLAQILTFIYVSFCLIFFALPKPEQLWKLWAIFAGII